MIRRLCHKQRTSESHKSRLSRKFATGSGTKQYPSLRLLQQACPLRQKSFLSGKSTKYFRHTRRPFSSHVADKEVQAQNAKHITQYENDETPAIFSSDQSAQDDDVEVEVNDQFHLFLESFAETIKRDVNDVISKIDAGNVRISESPIHSSDENVTNVESKALGPRKSLLQKRWERNFRRESRRTGMGSKKKKFEARRLSVEDMWDESLRRNGYSINQRPRETQPDSDEIKVSEGKINLRKERNDVSEGDHLSPVFRFPVNEQPCLADLEALVHNDRVSEEELDVQPFILNTPKNGEGMEFDTDNFHQNAVLRSISLLIAMRPRDWRRFDSGVSVDIDTGIQQVVNETENNFLYKDMHDDDELMNEQLDLDTTKTTMIEVREFLQLVKEQKYGLTTSMVNLLLAHLVISTEMENSKIGASCLKIFEEIKMLAGSGKHVCTPDSTTYRILILAFSRRLQGMGEAVKLAREMMEDPSIVITTELMNEALRACHATTELSVAKALMNFAFSNPRVRMNVESCILYTEMLKTRKLDQDAIQFFRDIQETKFLTQNDEDEYLMSLCRWPKRSRRGDVLDLSSFWTEILCILEERTRSTKKPDIRVWITFLEGLYNSAKSDDSLWNLVGDAMKTVLGYYPTNFVGRKLMTVGLDASAHIEDPELASMILKRVADESSIRSIETKTLATVPFRAVKNALEICLRISDAESARSIRESLERLGDPYPDGAKSELDSLVLLCHAKMNDAENAKHDLQVMIDSGMKPSEELFSAVLHTMAVTDRYEEMEELFQSMKMTSKKGMGPGVSAYDAILLARIRTGSWDDAIGLYEQMKSKDIVPSPRTIQGLLVATDQKGGQGDIISALESLLQCNGEFDETAFRLASKILFKGVTENPDEFRKSIRDIGEKSEKLRIPSLNLVRSVRFAEIESSRPASAHKSEHEMKKIREEAWRSATLHLLEFVKTWSENEDGIE